MHLAAAHTTTSGIHVLRDPAVRLLMATLLALCFSLFVPSLARAGGYTVLECYPPYSNSAPDVSTSGDIDGSSILYSVDCQDKGFLLRAYNFTNGPKSASVRIFAPPGAYFHNLGFHMFLGPHAQSFQPSWSMAMYVFTPGGGGPGGSSWWAFPTNSVQEGDVALGGYNASSLGMDVACGPGPCVHEEGNWIDWEAMKNLNLEVTDPTQPTLSIGGSALAGGITHGTPALDINAGDLGGGVRTVTVDVNGERVATPQTNCPGIPTGATYATQVRPCSNFSSSMTLDTTRTPWRDGSNTLRVCAADFATVTGTAANSVCDQRTISVDNSCADSSGASGQAESISAGLENPVNGQLSRSRAVRSTDGASVKGQLTAPGGGAVRAASICIYETVDEPAGIQQLVQVAKSRSDGSFGVQVPPGPSRIFQAAYRFNAQQIQTPTLYLDSSVKPTLELTRKSVANGRSLGFRGRIPGPHADGRAIALQARAGKKWRTFKQLITGQDGSYRGKYRFTQTHGHARYVFRALVKKQSPYPYSEGASQKRKVLVHG
jgi:hypothetical protein